MLERHLATRIRRGRRDRARPSRRAPRLHLETSSIGAPLAVPDGVEVAHLEEEANSVGGRLGRGARDLEEAPPRKKTTPRVFLAPLSVEGEVRRVFVEPERALES
jgi:hypothetical protein